MSHQLLLTHAGAARVAAAATAGTSLRITQFAVGQGSADFSQRLDQQSLVSPCYQGAVQGISAGHQPNQYRISCVVPPDAGGFTISEIGLIDSTGVLVWVGSLPPVQKPDAASSAAVDYRIDAVVQIDNPLATIVIDTSAVTATRSWVEQQLQLQIQRIEALERRKIEPVSIGGLLITTINYADSAAVRVGEGYGKWQRYAKGQVLLGATDYQVIQPDSDFAPYARLGEPDANGEARWFITGNKVGEYGHKLSISELPSHDHSVTVAAKDDSGGHYFANGGYNGTETDDLKVGATGGNVPHNIIQPSIVVGIWVRMPDDWTEEAYTQPQPPETGMGGGGDTGGTPPPGPTHTFVADDYSIAYIWSSGEYAGGTYSFFIQTANESRSPINATAISNAVFAFRPGAGYQIEPGFDNPQTLSGDNLKAQAVWGTRFIPVDSPTDNSCDVVITFADNSQRTYSVVTHENT